MPITIGVLALQGAVEPHLCHLARVTPAIKVRPVRAAEDFRGLSGLILPGGESTTQLRLLTGRRLLEPLATACAELPVWGVCAGAILLAREVRPGQTGIGAFDIVVERNAYGRQLDSFAAVILDTPVAFIRAPIVLGHGPDVRVRARHGDHAVWLEQGRLWVTTFHAELSQHRPSPLHREFVERCR